ncbi:hypothetical protein JCM19233_4781 [Vibrio astriarenae]|nr:hypothetical protein JCM19233_4781 [Vibrio sp. C7]
MLWGAVAKITDSSDWHQHEMLELIYCLSGEGTFVTSKLRVNIKPNRTILVAPNTQHHFEFDDGKYVELKVMCVTPQDLSSFLAPNLMASVDALVEKQVSHTDYVDDADFVSTLVAKLPNEIVTQNDEGAHSIWGTLGLLLTLHSQPHLEQMQAVPSQYRSAIYNVTRWLDSHLFQVHKLDDLASRFGLSRSLLTKEFRKNTGAVSLNTAISVG